MLGKHTMMEPCPRSWLNPQIWSLCKQRGDYIHSDEDGRAQGTTWLKFIIQSCLLTIYLYARHIQSYWEVQMCSALYWPAQQPCTPLSVLPS